MWPLLVFFVVLDLIMLGTKLFGQAFTNALWWAPEVLAKWYHVPVVFFRYGFSKSISKACTFSTWSSQNIDYSLCSIVEWNGSNQKTKESILLAKIKYPRYNYSSEIVVMNQATYFDWFLYLVWNWLFILVVCTTLVVPMIERSLVTSYLLWLLVLHFVTYIMIFFGHTGYKITKLKEFCKQQHMESLWFENSFDAYSQDPVESRMIITPAFMDRLEQFSKNWKLKWKIRIIWKQDSFTLLLEWDIEKYGKESDGSYTLVKNMEEILNLKYYSLIEIDTGNIMPTI